MLAFKDVFEPNHVTYFNKYGRLPLWTYAHDKVPSGDNPHAWEKINSVQESYFDLWKEFNDVGDIISKKPKVIYAQLAECFIEVEAILELFNTYPNRDDWVVYNGHEWKDYAQFESGSVLKALPLEGKVDFFAFKINKKKCLTFLQKTDRIKENGKLPLVTLYKLGVK